MEKPDCFDDRKEFFVGKPTGRKIVVLAFIPKTVTFELSYKEWENIIKFLRMTINRKLIHKNARGYLRFRVDKNKFEYHRYNRKDFFTQGMISVRFELGRAKVQIQRDEFVRFRKFCIDANNHFTSPQSKACLPAGREQFK